MGSTNYDSLANQPNSFTIDQADETNPTLNIISPTLGETLATSQVKITLEARDETAWSNLKIRIGQIVLFDLINDGGSLTSQNLVYTNNFIFLDKLFSLGSQPKLDNHTLSIKLTDFGNNEVQVFVNVATDLEKPVVEIESLSESLITTGTSVSIEWRVIDQSSIQSQQILLNGQEIHPIVELSDETYSIRFELSTSVEKFTQYTFTIVATDSLGNVGRNSTTVTFLPPSVKNDSTLFDLQTLLVLLGTILGFVLIIIYVVRQSGEKVDKSLQKRWEGKLVPPPLLELLEIQIKEDPTSVLELTDTFSRIENTWNESANLMITKTEISKLDISDFIDTFNSNLMLQLFNETSFSHEQFQIMEQKLALWKSEIMVKSKEWKGKLKVPPLENIVDQYPTEKFTNYTEFVKTIGVLLDSWEVVSQRIMELDKPTIIQIRGILNDYESETIILLAKTREFTRTEINEIEASLENWMQNIL